MPVDDPLHTVSAGGTHPAEVRARLIKYYSEGGQWQDARTPLHTFPTRDRIGLITIHGKDDAIVDIGMRMLTPRELARAQGLPDSYMLDPVVNGGRAAVEIGAGAHDRQQRVSRRRGLTTEDHTMTTPNENSPLTLNASGQENRTAIEARGLSSGDNGTPA